MKRFCLTLDLKDDPELIKEYESWHKKVWPEIIHSIQSSGIANMEIYRVHTRLFMIMETSDEFTFEEKVRLDNSNPKVAEWEALMWKYQQALSFAGEGEKWMLMDRIFSL